MRDPLKLTDAVLRGIDEALCVRYHGREDLAAEVTSAICALRDAAQKVCASPRVHLKGAQGAVDNSYYHVHPTAMILLAALLPDSEVKP